MSDWLVRREIDRLILSPLVHVDVHELLDLPRHHTPSRDTDPSFASRLTQRPELLPHWDDDWVVVQRERFRIMRLEALDTLAAQLIEQRSPGDALVPALEAVRCEPLRESAWRLVVRAHLDQGNQAAALLAYRDYDRLLRDELGIAPSPLMGELIAPLLVG